MKNLILATFLFCLIGFSLTSQEKIREFHVTTNLSFLYKQQFTSNENFLWTVGVPRLSFEYQTYESTNSTVLSFASGLGIGLEFRFPFNEVISLYHGPSLNGIYSLKPANNNFPFPQNSSNSRIGGSLIYNVGLLFKVNNHFLFSAQISPSFSYDSNQYSNVNTPNSNRTTVSLNRFPLSGGIVYRF